MKYRLSLNNIGYEHKDGYIEIEHSSEDDLVESYPLFLMTDKLINIIRENKLSGIDSIKTAIFKPKEHEFKIPHLLQVNFSTNQG